MSGTCSTRETLFNAPNMILALDPAACHTIQNICHNMRSWDGWSPPIIPNPTVNWKVCDVLILLVQNAGGANLSAWGVA